MFENEVFPFETIFDMTEKCRQGAGKLQVPNSHLKVYFRKSSRSSLKKKFEKMCGKFCLVSIVLLYGNQF